MGVSSRYASKWKSTMPREAPEKGKAHVVVAMKFDDGSRSEYTGQMPTLDAQQAMTRACLVEVKQQPRRVVCAANRHEVGDGEILILGARHYDDAMHAQYDRMQWHHRHRHCPDKDQGFIDQFGVFMTRKEAWGVAKAAGQIVRRCGGDGERLYSENLY